MRQYKSIFSRGTRPLSYFALNSEPESILMYASRIFSVAPTLKSIVLFLNMR